MPNSNRSNSLDHNSQNNSFVPRNRKTEIVPLPSVSDYDRTYAIVSAIISAHNHSIVLSTCMCPLVNPSVISSVKLPWIPIRDGPNCEALSPNPIYRPSPLNALFLSVGTTWQVHSASNIERSIVDGVTMTITMTANCFIVAPVT